VSDRPLQVFVSYARNDDLPPVDSDSKGFVTTLLRHLEYHFKSLGPPYPVVWRDTRAIEPSGQFDPVIAAGIDESDVLLVVLSNNWVSRPYCLRELELFEKRYAAEGRAATKRRTVVVAKHRLDPGERPELLQGQEGHAFYRVDDDDPARFVEVFGGARLSEDFHRAARTLAADLRNRSRASVTLPEGGGARVAEAASGERTIYVAKPAPDMKAPYARVCDELRLRGYRVVPQDDVPLDATARPFIQEALERAECSIHLLGDKAGFTPEDADLPIARLQLRLAAERVEAAAGPESHFHRIVWAPRFLAEDAGDGAARDPQTVLQRFDAENSSDKIDGGELGAFVEFAVQRLDRALPLATPSWDRLAPEARVYLCHAAEDLPYALEVGTALAALNIEPMLPALEGDPGEVAALHHRELADCDAVILCWANAPDVWLRSRSRELRSWRTLGREKQFEYRGVVAGPPPGQTKNVLLRLPPRSEIDIVLDLTETGGVTPETLGPLVHPRAASREST
jgi:hypothetical protein